MLYRLKRVSSSSAALVGATTGGVIAIVPSLALGLTSSWFAHVARVMLEGWQTVRISTPIGPTPALSFVALFHMEGALAFLRTWDGPLLAVAIATAGLATGAMLGAIGGAVSAALLTWSPVKLTLDLEPVPPGKSESSYGL